MKQKNAILTKKDFLAFLARGGSFDNTIQLNNQQYNKLSKDQKDGREPVEIMGRKGYVDGDKVWKSIEYINQLKKKGSWRDN